MDIGTIKETATVKEEDPHSGAKQKVAKDTE